MQHNTQEGRGEQGKSNRGLEGDNGDEEDDQRRYKGRQAGGKFTK